MHSIQLRHETGYLAGGTVTHEELFSLSLSGGGVSAHCGFIDFVGTIDRRGEMLLSVSLGIAAPCTLTNDDISVGFVDPE